MSITTVQSFSSLHKMSSEIFHFFWDFTSFCQSCDVTSHLICINKILNNSATKNTIKIKQTPFFIILKALPNKLIKSFVPHALTGTQRINFRPSSRVARPSSCLRVYLAFSVKRLCSEGIALDICNGFVGQAYERRWILPPVVWQNNRRMFGLISLYFSSLFPPFYFHFLIPVSSTFVVTKAETRNVSFPDCQLLFPRRSIAVASF